MSDDTYFFEVSVAEHPQTKKRMNDLAKSVIDAQNAMSGAVSLVGQAADASFGKMGSLLGGLQGLESGGVSSLKAIQAEVRSLQELSRQKIVQQIEIQRKDAGTSTNGNGATESVSPASAPVSRMTSPNGVDPSDYTDRLRKSETEERAILNRKVQDQESANGKVKNGLHSVGDELDVLRSETAKPIIQQVKVETVGSAPVTSTPQSEGQSTKGLDDYSDALMDSHVKDKATWEAKVETQKKAFVDAAAAYDKAVETQHKSAEEMNKAALKGARGLLDAAKGWTQLGLVSEENAEKLLKSLVVVEGAFNIAKGGIEFLEAFGQGWKAVRSSQEAANNISKITSALRSKEFAELRTYHLALVREAELASVAANANGRLAASRTAAAGAAGKGAVSGAVGSVASGAATSAVGSTVGSTVGGVVGGAAVGGGGAVAAGAAWNSLGGIALGGAATIGTFVAAVAGAGFGLRALYDVATGAGKSVGSFNDTIATWEAGVGASMLSMTGMFTSMDDPSTKFVQNLAAMTDSAGLSATGFGFLTGILGDFATAAASNAQLQKAEKNAKKIRAEVDFKDANENTRRDGQNQLARAAFDIRNQIRSISAGDDKELQLAAATERRADAAAILAGHMAKMRDLEAQNLKGTEAYRDAEIEAVHYRKELTDAIGKQQQLSKDLANTEIEGQKKVQDAISKKVEEAKKGLETLESKQTDAITNFSKMGKLEQVQSIDALNQARAKGGASLNDKQKELLRSVGTDEAKQLAMEGDRAEAADSGFNQTFGKAFEVDRQKIQATQQQLEADLSTKFDFTLDVKSNLDDMLSEMRSAAKDAAQEENARAIDAVRKMMAEGFAANRTANDQKLRTMNKSRG